MSNFLYHQRLETDNVLYSASSPTNYEHNQTNTNSSLKKLNSSGTKRHTMIDNSNANPNKRCYFKNTYC